MSSEATPKAPVLVTGAAGFIAFHLIERLLRAGRPVVGIDNFDAFYAREVKERNLADLRAIAGETGTRLRFEEGDVTELAPGAFADEPIESIIHLAAKAGVRPSLAKPEAYLLANVQGTLRVLEHARARGVTRVVLGSSSSVYGDVTPAPFREDAPAATPVSPYAASKRAAELYCEAYAHLYDLRIAVLRFFTVYGPRQRPDLAIHKFASLILAGEPITLFGDGSTERDYTYVGDIVDGVVAAERWTGSQPMHACEIFNLGGARTVSLAALVAAVEAALGRKAVIERAPAQPGDVQRTSADVTKSARVLGYAPKTPLAEGLRSFVRWLAP